MIKQLFTIIVFTILLGCLAWSCTNNAKRIKHVELVSTAEGDCTCPHCRLLIQPYGDFSNERAKVVAEELEKNLDKYVKDLAVTEVKVLPAKPLTEDLINDAKTRYRADKIIKSIKENHHDVIIVLTHQDISCTLRGKADWGVQGLSIMSNHYVCVVSDFRIKNKKRDLWKVAAHEFFHAYCSLPHCPNDDPNCLMQDAKGHPNYTTKEYLCKNCTEKCNI